jgi:hypothetical protein
LALDCLSLWTCAIARVFAPARLIRRFPNLLLRLRALCALRGKFSPPVFTPLSTGWIDSILGA